MRIPKRVRLRAERPTALWYAAIAVATLALVASVFTATRTPAQQNSEISQLFAKYGFKQNIVKPPVGILKHEYLVPAGPYTQLFDWDTYFMGVALSYDNVGAPLENSTKDFLDFTSENYASRGYTPREVATDAFDALPQMCKPFLAQMAVRASETLRDYTWLREPSGDTHRTGGHERRRRPSVLFVSRVFGDGSARRETGKFRRPADVSGESAGARRACTCKNVVRA